MAHESTVQLQALVLLISWRWLQWLVSPLHNFSTSSNAGSTCLPRGQAKSQNSESQSRVALHNFGHIHCQRHPKPAQDPMGKRLHPLTGRSCKVSYQRALNRVRGESCAHFCKLSRYPKVHCSRHFRMISREFICSTFRHRFRNRRPAFQKWSITEFPF